MEGSNHRERREFTQSDTEKMSESQIFTDFGISLSFAVSYYV